MEKIDIITLAEKINNAENHSIEITYISNSALKRKHNATDRKYGYIGGIVNGKVLIKENYGELINRKLSAKGLPANYKVSPRPFGGWISDDKLLGHKGNAYLRCFYRPENLSVNYVSTRGAEVPVEYLQKKGMIKPMADRCVKQMKYGLAPEECVLLKNIRLDSIISVTIDNVTYEVSTLKDALEKDFLRTIKPIVKELEKMRDME